MHACRGGARQLATRMYMQWVNQTGHAQYVRAERGIVTCKGGLNVRQGTNGENDAESVFVRQGVMRRRARITDTYDAPPARSTRNGEEASARAG